MVAKIILLALATGYLVAIVLCEAGKPSAEVLIEFLEAYDKKVKEYYEAPEVRNHPGNCPKLHQPCSSEYAAKHYIDPKTEQKGSPTGRALFSDLISFVYNIVADTKKDSEATTTTPASVPDYKPCCGEGRTLECNGYFCMPCIRNATKIGNYFYGESCF